MIKLLKKIHIHPLFWVIIGMGVLTGRFKEVLMLLLIVLIHELGHVVAASYLGWRVIKIELLPFGGAAELDAQGIRPAREEVLIVLCGPLQHVWMIALSFLLLNSADVWTLSDHTLFVGHNLAILVFNLLPIFPLDGGRLLQLFFYRILPYKRALQYSANTSISMLFIGFLYLILFSFQLNVFLIFLFLVIVQYLEYKQRNYRFIRFLMEKQHDETSVRTTKICVQGHDSIKVITNQIKRNALHRVVVVEHGKKRECKMDDVLTAYFNKKNNSPSSTLFH